MTEQESRRGKSRRERVEFARSRDILDVANELQMELVRSGRDYRWKEHDSLVISPDKNLWKWFSRNTGGDSISLVETIKEVDFNQSVDFLNDGNFKEFQMVERPQEDFKYYLEKYEQPLSAGRDYLRNQRGLSDETIDYFLEQGILAQANAKLDYFVEGNGGNSTNAIEPVIVFKSLSSSSSGEVVGASLQGIQENWEKWPKHGYAKVIMKNSDPMTGIHVDIGSPKRLIFTESPIDLMSYYELHKDSLQDVRLVSMDGLKESTIGRHLSQIQAEISGKPLRWTPEQLADGLQVAIDHHFFEDGKNADLITLALDNDKAGRTFIQELEAKGAVINSDLPELKPGQDKTDWNDVLKNRQEDKTDNSRLAQARRKLERLKGEQDDAISRAYSHQALTNGQPMNDKRGGASFMRKQEQIEGQVFSKMDEIRQQEERVERLEHQQHLKEMGLNRQGSGLEMSVQNIPRIREELEKAERGESFFTKATLKRYQEKLTRLEGISEQMGKTNIQPATQTLIDEGLVNQWQKQPNTYFVKGLRRVALELTEEGEFQLSSQTKYHPKTDEERLKVDELLAKQAQGNAGVKQMIEEERSSVPPELFVAFDFTENPNLSQKFSSGDVIPYKDFIAQLYEENNLRMLSLGYDKTYIALQDEVGNRLTDDFRYDIGSEDSDLSTQLGETLPTPYLEQAKKADHDYQSQISAEENVQTESVESKEKAPENSQEQMNDRASGGEGYSQHDAVGSAEPEAELSATFEQTVASHPTSPYRYLHFSTTFEEVQRRQSKYHPITSDDLKRMNQYAGSIQKSSQWYLEELANSKIYYFYSNNGEVSLLDVNFKRENFLHLTGIRPVVPGRNAGDFVVDFAEGRGDYNQILVSNSLKEKLQVIPMLEDILDPKSFVLDNLDEVRIAQRLNFSEAIKSKDEDFLLLFKDIGEERVPASLMKIKRDLKVDVEKTKEKVILAVFRERDGNIEQLSINEDYVKDRGNELQTILKDGLFEEIKPDTTKEIEQTTLENTLNSPLLDSATFTQVLDTVYNLGVPGDISKTPEEFHQAWDQYLDYAKKYNDKFDQIIAAAGKDHLLDTNSDFYKEWKQDYIYKEHYHVRLQWSEERPDGPRLPFKETELISYQDFARELYKANQSFYQLHQEGLQQVTGGHPEAYISPTKIQFSIYAPDGELIQDSIRYNIGEEINPIAHKERLGTREMREYPELMKIDGTIFTPYHLERLASELDISQFSYALEDTPYADQLLSRLPYGDLENSPIGFTDSSHDSRLGFISFDGMDSVEVESLSAWFEKLGVKDSPLEQVALVEKWQKEIKSLSEKVEQTIATVRDEFEKSQEEEIKLEEQGHNKQELKRDADADGIPDEEELLQGTNPYDFRSKPGSKPEIEEGLQAEEVVLAAGSLAVADFIQNKDMAGLSRHLKEGIKEFLDSDKYKDYLTKMSQLNNYSNRNLRLILAQNPEARQVASFKQWKENFGRYVKKGEKALRIFKPMTKIKKDENNQPILDKNGKPETVTFFGLVPVFDVSQTEGKEMPKAAEVKEQLTDLDYANLYRALMAIAKENDISVRFEEMENNKHGYYSVPENQIVLRSNEMNKAQIIKTFLHEMAHAELHHADNPQKENLTRSTAELQAESVAYVVSSYYGIDTSEYSFNYLSGWSADKETLADLEAQLDIVQQEAKSLMVRMDQALEQLRLSQEKQTKRSFEQKLEKFKDQSKQAVEDHKQELKADAQSKKEKGFSK